jgi:hypothetical protein
MGSFQSPPRAAQFSLSIPRGVKKGSASSDFLFDKTRIRFAPISFGQYYTCEYRRPCREAAKGDGMNPQRRNHAGGYRRLTLSATLVAVGLSLMCTAARTSALSEKLEFDSTSSPDLGHDVAIFSPSMSSAEIQARIDKVYAMQEHNDKGEISNVIDDAGGPTSIKPRITPKVTQFP